MSLLGERTRAIYLRACQTLKLPHEDHPFFDGVELHFGPNRYFLRYGYLPFNDRGSADRAADKRAMNKALQLAGFPVPQSTTFYRNRYAENCYDLQALPYPLVGKPTRDGAFGRHVVCNIQSQNVLKTYLDSTFKYCSAITLEHFCDKLQHYRVLVFYGKVIGVLKRLPARIIGDGVHNINQLIEIENQIRRPHYTQVTYGDLQVDQEYLLRLAELGLSLESIPKPGEKITLCYKVNASCGGTVIGLGAEICEENAALCVSAANALNLNHVGFDLACRDIQLPIETTEGYFIEANTAPDLTIHEVVLSGKAQPVSQIILKRFIRMHPFYYWQYRLNNAIPAFLRNSRLWFVLCCLLGLHYVLR